LTLTIDQSIPVCFHITGHTKQKIRDAGRPLTTAYLLGHVFEALSRYLMPPVPCRPMPPLSTSLSCRRLLSRLDDLPTCGDPDRELPPIPPLDDPVFAWPSLRLCPPYRTRRPSAANATFPSIALAAATDRTRPPSGSKRTPEVSHPRLVTDTRALTNPPDDALKPARSGLSSWARHMLASVSSGRAPSRNSARKRGIGQGKHGIMRPGAGREG